VASSPPQAARVPHLLRLPLFPPLSRAAAVWTAALTLLFALISLLYLLQTSAIATSGYDIQRLQAEQKAWELKNEQLQLELAKMQSLAWVETRAGQLGMQRPEQTMTVRVSLPAEADHGR
jgi:hypothetical protein